MAQSKLIFEWDASKARKNLAKHQVGFQEAKTVFNDPFLIAFPDEEHSDYEERLIGIGTSANNRLLLICYTEHEQDENVIVIRIISCRKTTALERQVYEQSEE